MRNCSGLRYNLSSGFKTIKRLENNTLYLSIKTVKAQCLPNEHIYRRTLHGHFESRLRSLFSVQFLENTINLFSDIIILELYAVRKYLKMVQGKPRYSQSSIETAIRVVKNILATWQIRDNKTKTWNDG